MVRVGMGNCKILIFVYMLRGREPITKIPPTTDTNQVKSAWVVGWPVHYAEKHMGVRHGSFWFSMSAPIKKKTSHIFTQQGCEARRLKAKLDAPNVNSSLQLQFIFIESKFKIKYYLASTLSPHSV